MKISEVSLRHGSDHSIILRKNDYHLSDISNEILSSALLADSNTLVLSQGPLNMTPLISTLYAFSNNTDVLVFLPWRQFERLYDKYVETFFSLQYARKDNPLNALFFYYDVLLFKGRLDDNLQLSTLELEINPHYGSKQFREDYRRRLLDDFKRGQIAEKPKIIFVPINATLSLQALGEKEVRLGEKIANVTFSPSFFIFESINEAVYNFELLLNLIKRMNDRQVHFLMHFSWPYFMRLNNFLTKVEALGINKPKIFHLGKRLTFEIGQKMHQPNRALLTLSMEGKLWDHLYCPINNNKNIEITLPLQSTYSIKSPDELSHINSEFDHVVTSINNHLDNSDVDNYILSSLLRFPPSMNAFVVPSELKKFDRDISKQVPIHELIERRLGKDSVLMEFLNDISNTAEMTKDIGRELHGLHSHNRIGKRSLLQMYILQFLHPDSNIKIVESDEKAHIVLLNLYSDISSSSALSRSIDYLIEGLQKEIQPLRDISITTGKGSALFMSRKKLGESIELIADDGNIRTPTEKAILSIIKPKHQVLSSLQVTVMRDEESLSIRVLIPTNISCGKVSGSTDFSKLVSEMWRGIPIVVLRVQKDGHFNCKIMDSIAKENHGGHIASLSTSWRLFNNSGEEKRFVKKLDIDYLGLQQLRMLDNDTIMKSHLIIPGPIPFTSISGDRIFLSHGYDALLLPFHSIRFLAYPGRNYQQVMKQLKIYAELFSKDLTEAAVKDRNFSLKYTHFKKIYVPRNLSPVKQVEQTSSSLNTAPDGTFDDIARDTILNNNEGNDQEQKDMVTIKKLLEQIEKSHKDNKEEDLFDIPSHLPPLHEDVRLEVDFGEGRNERISFPVVTLLRKKLSNEYVLFPAGDLEEGDEVIYIETSIRESVDSYILKDYLAENQISLEQIFEPMTCLKTFVNVLQSVLPNQPYPEERFSKLYWLTEGERKTLFRLLLALLEGKHTNIDQEFFEQERDHNIWADFLSPFDVIKIFRTGIKRVTAEKLYYISNKAGLSLAPASFKQYISLSEGWKHYFFANENDLKAIGLLTGNNTIIDRFEVINEYGREMTRILQIVGKSVARVARGMTNPLNEVDQMIDSSMKKCKIVKVDRIIVKQE